MVYTVGHSNHTGAAFAALLLARGIEQVGDVRSCPGSRRHPHFGREALESLLTAHRIGYRHFPGLGGRRRPHPRSPNTGWQHPAFRGFADYMRTAEFAAALDDLLLFAAAGRTAVMCAEALWWQCHRRLIADALVLRGLEVRHIVGAGEPRPHELTPFAVPGEGGVTYPGLL